MMPSYSNLCQKTTKFIDRAITIHGAKYGYSDAVYVSSSVKLCVVCPQHGKFFVLPGNHLTKKSGCPECARASYGLVKKLRAKHTFVGDCEKLFRNKYDYSQVNYTLSHDKVKIGCPIHGVFEMMPYCHRQGQGCPVCGITSRATGHRLKQDQFISRSIETHGNKYDYTYAEYVRADVKVQIICKLHGPFFQRPDQHTNKGEGCPDCGKRSWFAEQGGYSQSMFDRHPAIKETPGMLYIVEFSSEVERFYKIGITKNTLKERFRWGYGDYVMRVISEHHTTLYCAWLVEQEMIANMKQYRYIPHVKIGGYTECFSKYLNINEFSDQICHLLNK